MDRATLLQLRRQQSYPSFYAAATLARLADEMFAVGVVLLILDRTGSAALAGLTVAAIALPSVVSGPLIGAWLDLSGRRRNVMLFDQIVIGVTLVALVALTGEGPDWLLPLLVVPAGLTYPLSFAGYTSIIPAIVDDELLPPANALEATSFNLAIISGPALAGTLVAVAGPPASLLVEAGLSFAVMPLILRVPALNRAGSAAGRTLGDVVRSGLRHLASVPPLRGITATGAIGLGGLGFLTVAFPFLATDALGADRSAAGFLWAAFAFGSTVGALSLVRLQSIGRPENLVFAGIAALGCLMLLWPLADSLAVAIVLVALAAVVDGPAFTATFTVRQRWTPPELHGQVFATAASLKVGAFAVGAALAGPAVTAFGAKGTLVLVAGIQLAAAATGLALSRSPQPLPESAGAG